MFRFSSGCGTIFRGRISLINSSSSSERAVLVRYMRVVSRGEEDPYLSCPTGVHSYLKPRAVAFDAVFETEQCYLSC